MGRFKAEVEAAAANLPSTSKKETTIVEQFTGFYIDSNPSVTSSPSKAARSSQVAETALGDIEDEVIVYVAPHPRAGPVTPPPKQSFVPYTSILTGRRSPVEETMQEKPMTADEPTRPSSIQAADVQHPAAGAEEHTTTDTVMSIEETKETEIVVNQDILAPDIDVAPTAEAIEAISSHTTETTGHDVTVNVIETTIEASTSNPTGTVVTQNPTESIRAAAFEELSFSFASKLTTHRKPTRKLHPVRTPKALRRPQPRRKSLRHFGVFDTQLEKAHLHEGEDPRKNERRRGDYDLDWGTGDEDENEEEEEKEEHVSSPAHQQRY